MIILTNRLISQMTYEPKSVGEMADFETLTLCIFLNSSQMCTYYLEKNTFPYLHPFPNWFYYPYLVAMGLT